MQCRITPNQRKRPAESNDFLCIDDFLESPDTAEPTDLKKNRCESFPIPPSNLYIQSTIKCAMAMMALTIRTALIALFLKKSKSWRSRLVDCFTFAQVKQGLSQHPHRCSSFSPLGDCAPAN